MISHDDAHDGAHDLCDPRHSPSVAVDSAAAAMPAEAGGAATDLSLLGATPPIPGPHAQPLALRPLCLNKDTPLRRFGH